MDQIECVVVGAGVVGLAVARTLALAGREVLLLEAADSIGSGTSSRNSEVIHAGIYYPQDWLKARLCVPGRALLYDYCAQRYIQHRRCGKLIVATSARQLVQLEQVAQQAQRNGVTGLRLLSRAQARQLEPALRCAGALLSPDTGIVDSHALMFSLWADFENSGGNLALHTRLLQVHCAARSFALHTVDGSRLQSKVLVNAAGLQAPALAKSFTGLAPQHVLPAYYAKGNYFTLAGRAPFSHLIYPLPEAAGLGVHLTLDLAGQAKFGPDVQWLDDPDDLRVEPSRGDAFYTEVRKYWPALRDGSLQPGFAGIRPKLSGPGSPAVDFVIQGPATHGVSGLVNLFGIESPGLTSCLAIAQMVAALV